MKKTNKKIVSAILILMLSLNIGILPTMASASDSEITGSDKSLDIEFIKPINIDVDVQNIAGNEIINSVEGNYI